MEKFTGLYTGAVVLPGVTIGEGSMVGAGSLIRKDVTPWEIWFGNPAKRISRRRKDLLRLVDDMVAATRNGPGAVSD
jgi:acetyltransferase-like isoleucine patch superfamily enzyme